MSSSIQPGASPARQTSLPFATLILGGAAIGGSPIFVRLSEVGPVATGFWRVALAMIPFAIAALLRGRRSVTRPASIGDVALLALPGICLAVDLLAWHLSLHLTSVTNATLLANVAPLFVAGISWLLFRARISKTFLIGLATAIIGIVTLKGGIAVLAHGDLRGDGLAIVAALFYAGYFIVLGQLRSRYDTLQIMLWSTGVAAVCLLPVALIWEPTIFPPSLHGWLLVIGLAFISHAGGQAAIAYALAYLPPAFSSLTLLLQPVVAAILAWALLGEAIGFYQLIGGAIVLLGILIARRG